jgi:hypothetical protein
VPSANEGLAGVMASEIRLGCPTESVAEAEIDPEVAVIVELPTPVPEATPVPRMLATAVEEDVQATVPVTSCVLESV